MLNLYTFTHIILTYYNVLSVNTDTNTLITDIPHCFICSVVQNESDFKANAEPNVPRSLFFPISRCRNGHLFTRHGHPPDPKHETVSSSLFNLPPVRLSSRRRAKEMPITKVIECCFPQLRLWGAFLLLWLVSALECGANDVRKCEESCLS